MILLERQRLHMSAYARRRDPQQVPSSLSSGASPRHVLRWEIWHSRRLMPKPPQARKSVSYHMFQDGLSQPYDTLKQPASPDASPPPSENA